MKSILLVSRTFFSYSETFIYRQVLALSKEHSLTLMAFTFQNVATFPLNQVNRIQLSYSVNAMDRLATGVLRTLLRMQLPFSILTGGSIRRYFQKNIINAVHAHYGWNGIAILPYAKEFNIPLVVSFHGADASYSLRQAKYREQLIPLFEYSSLIVLCSSYMTKNLPLEKYLHKVRIVPYGVDVNLFSPVPTLSLARSIKVLHVGRIVPKKGVPDLIRVFKKLKSEFPHIELEIIGGGKQFEECKNLIDNLQLQHVVKLSGPQTIDVVLDALRSADIFVLNSRTDEDGDEEGLPNGLLEAMSCAKAVISTYHAGIPDAIKNGVNGILIEEKNNAQLYEAMRKLIEDSELREKLGKEARKTILDSFSMERMERNLIEIISDATHSPIS